MRTWLTFLTLAMLTLLAGCGPSEPPSSPPRDQPTGENKPMPEITIKSPSFDHGQPIPTRNTGDGADVSPMLRWAGVPDEAKELALICDDPDAPTPEPWVHWVLYKIPEGTAGLPEQIFKSAKLDIPVGAYQGTNSWDAIGYGGPAPPPGHGTHHYHFKLYALDTTLDVPEGIDKAALLKAMEGHVIAEGELIGTYER